MRPASRESVGWADFQENKDHGKEIEREMDFMYATCVVYSRLSDNQHVEGST